MSVKDRELAIRLGKAIARKRNAAKLTQEQVAEQLKIGNEAYSRIERGLVALSVERLYRLSEIFECDSADLLTETSVRVEDQARLLEEKLAMLTVSDRELVLEIVRQLSERLSR